MLANWLIRCVNKDHTAAVLDKEVRFVLFFPTLASCTSIASVSEGYLQDPLTCKVDPIMSLPCYRRGVAARLRC